MRVADFFCGGGGFSEGFRQAGFEIAFAVDKWEPAITTYRGNKPGVKAIQDDVIRISKMDDKDFNDIVPDTEIIIGSPPCQVFSHSNNSGNADKSVGIELIKAYLRIIARKKFKPGSILKYWILENVPNVKNYIQEEYTAKDLNLEGNFVLYPHRGASDIYNAMLFGAPTNRKRYLCGEFPRPEEIRTKESATKLNKVLKSLGEPLDCSDSYVVDINYPDLKILSKDLSDHHYIYELAPFEWMTAKRLKEDKGYMGKMSFPERLDKPSRTIMATMSTSSRESMILGMGNNRYRLPTVREVASMMSFPIDYRFFGKTKAIKHTLVGNAVPPKMSYAIAKAIANAENLKLPQNYIPIHYDNTIPFIDLNGSDFPLKREKGKKLASKFKYHIPYLIISAFRVELTNYNSDFDSQEFHWDVEIHYSQGKSRACKFTPQLSEICLDEKLVVEAMKFKNKFRSKISSHNKLQNNFCLTSEQREKKNIWGPYELLNQIKSNIIEVMTEEEQKEVMEIKSIFIKNNNKLKHASIPIAVLYGYYLLKIIIDDMESK